MVNATLTLPPIPNTFNIRGLPLGFLSSLPFTFLVFSNWLTPLPRQEVRCLKILLSLPSQLLGLHYTLEMTYSSPPTLLVMVPSISSQHLVPQLHLHIPSPEITYDEYTMSEPYYSLHSSLTLPTTTNREGRREGGKEGRREGGRERDRE